jgi:hypothetical protein
MGWRWWTLSAVVGLEAALIRLGRTHGSTAAERATELPGAELVPHPDAITDHARTLDAAPQDVWPWIVQMGWGRAGWYTPRWVDRLLFPANGASADRVVPDLQDLAVGDFVPDGPPSTGCGFVVEQLVPDRALVLRSTSHLPPAWRRRAAVDWSWAFVLTATDEGRTRYHVRSRWTTAPWWLTAAAWLAIVPADLYMSAAHLRGVERRAAGLARSRHGGVAPAVPAQRAG